MNGGPGGVLQKSRERSARPRIQSAERENASMLTAPRLRDLTALPEPELVSLVRAGDAAAVRFVVQAHNRRLYRVARAVLHDDSEAEDVVQEAYVRAFTHFADFRGDSGLATWLTRIALNEALGRLRKRRPKVELDALDTPQERERMQVIPFPLMKHDADPEQSAARRDVRRLLERAIDGLSEPFRLVFVLRDVEEMTVEETAAELGLRPETVRTRLHRARTQLRQALDSELSSALTDAFPFGGARCARLADTVLSRLQELEPTGKSMEDER
jgi:RNA polymerase sigma-70 factor (ECF subfamily)